MWNKRVISLCFFSAVFSSFLIAQNHSGIYPKGYFINPLDIPASLAGNFGELRPNHYHMGLDFKTNRIENLPVYASADGYVARIKVEPFGYGKAVYINHPNGLTTVYAHLNTFFPELEEYVKEQQYKLESWNVYLTFPERKFPVKKGQIIARSGNTGGSMGPHLHFEIRNTASDTNLNPILFGFPIKDNIAPVIQRLAIYNRNKSTYEQSPHMVALKKTPEGYTSVPSIITVSSDKISFAVGTYDLQSAAPNHNGVFQGILFENNAEIIRFAMDTISYNDTRYLNAHIDYKTKAGGGPYLQHLSELPGYTHSIYKQKTGNGIIRLREGSVYSFRIEIKDGYNNIANLRFKVQYKPGATTPAPTAGKMSYPLMVNVGDGSDDCEFYIGEKALYDSVRIAYRRNISSIPEVVSAVHTIGTDHIPLQEGLMLRIKPDTALSGQNMNRTVVQRFSGTKKEVAKPQWQNGWAVARFNSFGSFQLVLDEEPPQIIPVGFINGQDMSKAKSLVFTASDNMGVVKNFRAELDGKWLLFSNDKGKRHIYRFDDRCSPGKHSLKISLADEAGNTTEQTYTFTR